MRDPNVGAGPRRGCGTPTWVRDPNVGAGPRRGCGTPMWVRDPNVGAGPPCRGSPPEHRSAALPPPAPDPRGGVGVSGTAQPGVEWNCRSVTPRTAGGAQMTQTDPPLPPRAAPLGGRGSPCYGTAMSVSPPEMDGGSAAVGRGLKGHFHVHKTLGLDLWWRGRGEGGVQRWLRAGGIGAEGTWGAEGMWGAVRGWGL